MTDYNAIAADFFKTYDKNGDGNLSIEEFTELYNALHASRPDLDLGKYTVQEMFGFIDKDGDGQINQQELANHLESQNFKL